MRRLHCTCMSNSDRGRVRLGGDERGVRPTFVGLPAPLTKPTQTEFYKVIQFSLTTEVQFIIALHHEMYVCMRACIYVFMCRYIHTHTYVHEQLLRYFIVAGLLVTMSIINHDLQEIIRTYVCTIYVCRPMLL